MHPSQLRAANRRLVFRLLLSHGPMSRAAIARATGLSAMTAGKVVDDLIADRLAEESDPPHDYAARATMGRPARSVRVLASREIPIVELGVRRTTVMAQPLACDRPPRRAEFAAPASPSALLARIDAARKKLELKSGGFVVVSVPGVLDAAAASVLCSPNLPIIENTGFLPKIGRLFRAEVCAVQEIQALALGHQAAADAPDSFVLLDFGDGVGGALVTGGSLFQGSVPMAGELGHTGVHGNHRVCACGAVGCVETLLSRDGLLTTFRARVRSRTASWSTLTQHVSSRGVEPWLAKAIDAAAVVIAGAINLVGTQHVVLTGDLPNLHPEIGPMFEQRVRVHSLIGRFGQLICRVAPRRRTLGLVAAAADRFLLAEPELVSPAAASQVELHA